MKTYNPDDYLHRFGYGEKTYTLEPLTPDSVEEATAVLAKPNAEKYAALLSFYEARTDKRTFASLRKLPVRLLFEEFLNWGGFQQSGVAPGESDGSPDK